MRVIEFAKLSS